MTLTSASVRHGPGRVVGRPRRGRGSWDSDQGPSEGTGSRSVVQWSDSVGVAVSSRGHDATLGDTTWYWLSQADPVTPENGLLGMIYVMIRHLSHRPASSINIGWDMLNSPLT